MEAKTIADWIGAIAGAAGAITGVAALVLTKRGESRQRATAKFAAIDHILLRHEKSRAQWSYKEPFGGSMAEVEKSVDEWRDLCEEKARILDRKSFERQMVQQLINEANTFLYELEIAKKNRRPPKDWITDGDTDIGDSWQRFRSETDRLSQQLEELI